VTTIHFTSSTTRAKCNYLHAIITYTQPFYDHAPGSPTLSHGPSGTYWHAYAYSFIGQHLHSRKARSDGELLSGGWWWIKKWWGNADSWRQCFERAQHTDSNVLCSFGVLTLRVGCRNVKFGFLNTRSSFATIRMLFKVFKNGRINVALQRWQCSLRYSVPRMWSASFPLLVTGRQRTMAANSRTLFDYLVSGSRQTRL